MVYAPALHTCAPGQPHLAPLGDVETTLAIDQPTHAAKLQYRAR